MDNSNSENLNLLVKNFSKKLNYKNKNKNKSLMPKKIYKNQDQRSIYTCYECGKQGQIKSYFPWLKLKHKLEKKKETKKYNKKKRAFIAWEYNASNTTRISSERDEKEANFFNEYCKAKVLSSSKSQIEKKIYQLLYAFKKIFLI